MVAGVVPGRCVAVVGRDDDVQVTRVEPGQRLGRVRLTDQQREPWPLLPQPGQAGGDQRGDGRRQRTDPHLADQALLPGCQVGPGQLEPLGHRPGVREQHPGLAGEPHPTALLLQQRHAEVTGEPGDLLGDGGRRQVQCRGGGDTVPRCSSSRSTRSRRRSIVKSRLDSDMTEILDGLHDLMGATNGQVNRRATLLFAGSRPRLGHPVPAHQGRRGRDLAARARPVPHGPRRAADPAAGPRARCHPAGAGALACAACSTPWWRSPCRGGC